MINVAWVALGGAAGSVMRYGLARYVNTLARDTFPAGTLVVNALGCLLMGVMAGLIAGSVAIREEYRIAIMVGVLGGFTTYSSFGLDTFHLVRQGKVGLAVVYVVATNVLALGANWIGYWVAKKIAGD